MALIRLIVATFAMLVNLAFAGVISPNTGNECWKKAIELSGCLHVADRDLCLCRTVFDRETFQDLRDFCGSVSDILGPDPLHACDKFGPAATVTTFIKRVPSPVANIYSTVTRTPMGPNFCGLPGTPCLGGWTDEDDSELDQAKQPIVTPLLERVPSPVANIYSTVTRTPMAPGFCGLPGTPCLGGWAEEKPQNEARNQAQPNATPAFAPHLKPRVGSSVIPFPTMNLEKRQDQGNPLPLRNTKTLRTDNSAPRAASNAVWKVVLGLIIGVAAALMVI